MAILYLVKGKRLIKEIEVSPGATTALPLFSEKENMCLINQDIMIALANTFDRTAVQIIDDSGLVDERPVK